MISLVILLALSVIIGEAVNHNRKKSLARWARVSTGWSWICAAISIVVMISVSAFTKVPEEVNVESYTYIYNIQDNMVTEGGGGLFHTVIDGEPYYFYYYKVRGGYKLGRIPTYKATIRYSSDHPRLVEAKERYRNEIVWWWKFGNTLKTRYYIDVPEGTIVSDFKLDAKFN